MERHAKQWVNETKNDLLVLDSTIFSDRLHSNNDGGVSGEGHVLEVYSTYDDTAFGIIATPTRNYNAATTSSAVNRRTATTTTNDEKYNIQTTNPCTQGTILRCVGSSVPKRGMKAFFSIQCGVNLTYFGSDLYFFTPSSSSSPYIRSYVCKGIDNSTAASTIRPQWRFRGYYPKESDCNLLQNASYNETLCSVSTCCHDVL